MRKRDKVKDEAGDLYEFIHAKANEYMEKRSMPRILGAKVEKQYAEMWKYICRKLAERNIGKGL
jgi:hypothetical protein